MAERDSGDLTDVPPTPIASVESIQKPQQSTDDAGLDSHVSLVWAEPERRWPQVFI